MLKSLSISKLKCIAIKFSPILMVPTWQSCFPTTAPHSIFCCLSLTTSQPRPPHFYFSSPHKGFLYKSASLRSYGLVPSAFKLGFFLFHTTGFVTMLKNASQLFQRDVITSQLRSPSTSAPQPCPMRPLGPESAEIMSQLHSHFPTVHQGKTQTPITSHPPLPTL